MIRPRNVDGAVLYPIRIGPVSTLCDKCQVSMAVNCERCAGGPDTRSDVLKQMCVDLPCMSERMIWAKGEAAKVQWTLQRLTE